MIQEEDLLNRIIAHQLQVSGIRKGFKERFNLPMDQATETKFKMRESWIKYLDPSNINLGEMTLKCAFWKNLEHFWETQGSMSQGDAKYPPEIHYERIKRRFNENLASWRRYAEKLLTQQNLVDFSVTSSVPAAKKELIAKFERRAPPLTELLDCEAFLIERALPFVYRKGFLDGKGPLEQSWMVVQAKHRHREAMYNLQDKIDRIEKFNRDRGMCIRKFFVDATQLARKEWYQNMYLWGTYQKDLTQSILLPGLEMPNNDCFIPIIFDTMFHGTDSQLAEAEGVPQKTAIEAKNRMLRKSMRKQKLGKRQQNPLLGKDRIDLHLAIPKEEELAHLTQKEREAVFEFLMQHREGYVRILEDIDKENRDLCTAANQVYDVSLQAELAQFIGGTWAVQLGNMLTHEGLQKIIKLLRDNFLLEDDEEQMIDDYVPGNSEEEVEEGEVQESPEPTPVTAPDSEPQKKNDNEEVMITGEAKAQMGTESVWEAGAGIDGYWKNAIIGLGATFGMHDKNLSEAQLDADFQAVAERLAKDAAEGSKTVGIDDFPVYTMVVTQPATQAEDKAEAETEQTEQHEQAEQIEQREPETEIQETIQEEAPEQVIHESMAQPPQEHEGGGEEGPQESTGSASLKPVEYWETTTPRGRMGLHNKYPNVPVGDDDDIQRRFNGSKVNANLYSALAGHIIPDKGFSADVLNNPMLEYWQTRHGWSQFMTHNGDEGFVELTREFFCNLNVTNRTTWVRGTTVNLSTDYLNRFLGTPEHPNEFPAGEMLTKRPKTKDMDRLRTVARSLTAQVPQTFTFPASMLKMEYKPTYDFFLSKIRRTHKTHQDINSWGSRDCGTDRG